MLILDASEKLMDEDLSLISEVEKERTIVVLNKKDLMDDTAPRWYEKISLMESVLISAKTGEGCDDLESSLYKKATFGGLPQEDDNLNTTLFIVNNAFFCLPN